MQATIWAYITGLFFMFVLGETQLQIIISQIHTSMMKSFRKIPVFVISQGTSLFGNNCATNLLPEAQPWPQILSDRYLVTRTHHWSVHLQTRPSSREFSWLGWRVLQHWGLHRTFGHIVHWPGMALGKAHLTIHHQPLVESREFLRLLIKWDASLRQQFLSV